MFKLPLLMCLFLFVWVELLSAIYPLIPRSEPKRLTQEQIDEAHFKAYTAELNLYAAQAKYRALMAKQKQ